MDTEPSSAVLDSLTAEEFALIYAVYLVGCGIEVSPERARARALAAKFYPLESMAGDPNLHLVLTHGQERWHLQDGQS